MFMGVGLFSIFFEIFVENYVFWSHEPRPMLCLLILGVYGAFCLGIGHALGSRRAKANPAVEEDSASK